MLCTCQTVQITELRCVTLHNCRKSDRHPIDFSTSGRTALGIDFFCGVHGKSGVNKWVVVHEKDEDSTKMQNQLEAALNEEGWRVDFCVGDAGEMER